MELYNDSLMNSLAQRVSQWTNSFVKEEFVPLDRPMMPLYQVISLLHKHYVSQAPLYITFEYYNEHNRMEQETILADVQSALDKQRRIVLKEVNTQTPFIMPVEQILWVTPSE